MNLDFETSQQEKQEAVQRGEIQALQSLTKVVNQHIIYDPRSLSNHNFVCVCQWFLKVYRAGPCKRYDAKCTPLNA